MPTELLTTIACEPGSKLCDGCESYYWYDGPNCHYVQSFKLKGSEDEMQCRSDDEASLPSGVRLPLCLASESAARELREENERLWANLLNLTTGVLYLYNKATGAYNPKRLNVSKDALRSLYELATKLHEEAQKG